MPPVTNARQASAEVTPSNDKADLRKMGFGKRGSDPADDKDACFKEIGLLTRALLDVEERLEQVWAVHEDALEQKQAAHAERLQLEWDARMDALEQKQAAHEAELQQVWTTHGDALAVAQRGTQDVEQRYAAVLSSTSWRITAPLRRLTRLFR